MMPAQQKFPSLPDETALPRLFADLRDAVQTAKGSAEEIDCFEKFLKSISYSPFLCRIFLRETDFVFKICQNGFDKTFDALLKETFKTLFLCTDRQTVSDGLRILKRRVALLTGLADATGTWNLLRVTQALSVTAQAALRTAVSFVLRQAADKGELELRDNENPEKDSGFIVLAMGKLGAKELNYSSDIDLIFLYDADKTAYTGKRDISSFFVKLCREIVALMEEQTASGYVFRTDLRLRPDPASTPIALSTQAASLYYESFAQNWERAAFIKARAVAGDIDAGRAFLKDITPFIWRRSSDFYVLEQIHGMKHSSGAALTENCDVAGHNVKLAQGGIREIEFFTQLQQLLWAGRDTRLRLRATLPALKALTAAGWVKKEIAADLSDSYVFLRTLEHRLQMREDEQTQTLPKTAREMTEIARFTGFETREEFEKCLRAHLRRVQKNYDALFCAETAGRADDATLVFTGTDLPEETKKRLEAYGFSNFSFIADTVRGWLSGRYRSMRSDKARLLITGLLPVIFNALSKTGTPDKAFLHFDDFLKGLPSGVQLFSLFQSRPALVDLLAEIMGQSPFLAAELSVRPELFDAVLSLSFFERLPDRETLRADLKNMLELTDDLEQTLDACRRFAREKRFQTAVFFMRGLTDASEAGKKLADIADCVIEALFPAVSKNFERRFGKIDGARAAFVLMGKGGSREMSFQSDLDILFVYDADDTAQSDGKSPLSPSVYYARLAQRTVSALTANTRDGVLWSVDMRLRPSGSAGPAATSFAAFKRYYTDAAWTWEFQALTKARVIYADDGFKETLERTITEILCAKRDTARLADDVNAMRDKMLAEGKTPSPWNVKDRPNGMTDIEFAVQYLQLAKAHACPSVLQKNTLDVLKESAERGLTDAAQTAKLAAKYALWLDMRATASLCRDEETEREKTALKHGCADAASFAEKFLTETTRLRAPYDGFILR